MIDHQQFEEWVWSESRLDPEQAAALQEHLSSCIKCRELYASWEKIHGEMVRAPVINAPAGFAARWNQDLAERKMFAKEIQTRRMVLFSFSGALITFLAVIGLTFLMSSPVELVTGIVKSISGLITIINRFGSVFSSLIRIIPPIIPAFYWVAITTIFSFLALLWIVSIWRIAKQGVTIK